MKKARQAGKIRIAFLPVLLFAMTGLAQTVVSGKVISSEGTLEGATVLAEGLQGGATTDAAGVFRLAGVRGAACTLHVSRVGYAPARIRVALSGGETFVTVVLARSESQLNDVVVSGVSKATLIRESPLAMLTVSSRQIEQSAAPNVIDAIAAHAPGLVTVKTGPNVSKPFINGLGYNRVLTLYDGMRVETQQWGDEHGVPMDDYAIERAEVIRGPASLMYGSDAIAGVLSLFPAIPHGADGRLHIRVLSEYQTNNGLVGNGLMLSRANPRWSWALRGSERVARNYTDPVDGRVYNTSFRMGNASAFLGYTGKKGFSRLNATWYDNRQGIPDGSRDSLTRKFTYQVYETPGERAGQAVLDDIKNRPLVPASALDVYRVPALSQHIQDYRLYTGHVYALGGGQINASLGFEENRRREYDHPTDAARPGEYIILRTLNYGLRYNAPAVAGIDFSAGANGMYQTNRSDRSATDFPIPDYHLFDGGAYVYGKWKRGRWTMAGGFRYDHRSERGATMFTGIDSSGFARQVATAADTAGGGAQPFSAFSLSFQGISGSLGATFRLGERVSVKANVARGYRSPNITEIAASGLDPGAHIYYLGNLHFTPEFSLQEDVGINGDFDGFAFSLNLFNNSILHYIYEDQAVDAGGNPLVIIPGNKTFEFQQTNAQLYGGDAGFRIRPQSWRGVYADAAFACVYGYNRNAQYRKAGPEGEYLPFIPPPRWVTGAGYEHGFVAGALRSVSFRVEMDRSEAQHRYLGLFGTETPTAAYTLCNASAHTDFRYAEGKTLRIQLQVNNLFNAAYQSHLSRLQYFEYYTASPNGHLGIFEMGRNVCGKIIWTW